MVNPENFQRPFESDVFSLGMTMLHLAAMELPERTPVMSHGELQALLQRKVQTLKYSEELKRLLTAMLNTASNERPPLENVQTDAECIYRQATQKLEQEALQLRLQARSIIAERINQKEIELMMAASHANSFRLPEDEDELRSKEMSAEAVKKYAAAHDILSRLPDDKDIVNNLREWGDALCEMGRREEAVEKYAAAHAILSRLPDDKDTARNLREWGDVLKYIKRREAEAVEKYAAAQAIISRLPGNESTANYLRKWGDVLFLKRREAEAVEMYAAAQDILSRLPGGEDIAKNLREWGDIMGYMKGRRGSGEVRSSPRHFCFVSARLRRQSL